MPPVRSSRRPAALAVSLLLTLLAGCGDTGDTGDPAAAERVPGTLSVDVEDAAVSEEQDAVAQDPDATAAEIFAAGVPDEMDVRPDGSMVVAWRVSADAEGEGPTQVAWRVLDATGEPVAQGRMSEVGSVLAVADGFVVLDGELGLPTFEALHVDPRGKVTRVAVGGPRSVPGEGDTLVSSYDLVVRDAPRTLLRSATAPELPRGTAAGKTAALSDTGVLYQLADRPGSPLPVGITDDGGRTWRYTGLDVERGRPILVAAHGDEAVVAVSPRGLSPHVATMQVTEDAGRTWQRTDPPDGLAADAYVDHLTTGADGRALLGAYGTGWWRTEPGDLTSWMQVPLPADGTSDVRATEDGLLALGRTAIWSSGDDGAYWTRVDVGG